MADTVHLIGVGEVLARPAGAFLPGDRILWNYGHRSTVTGIVRRTPSQVVLALRDERGNNRERRFGKKRLLAIG